MGYVNTLSYKNYDQVEIDPIVCVNFLTGKWKDTLGSQIRRDHRSVSGIAPWETFTLFFWDCGIWDSLIRPEWVGNESQGDSCLRLSRTGIIDMCHQACLWILGLNPHLLVYITSTLLTEASIQVHERHFLLLLLV